MTRNMLLVSRAPIVPVFVIEQILLSVVDLISDVCNVFLAPFQLNQLHTFRCELKNENYVSGKCYAFLLDKITSVTRRSKDLNLECTTRLHHWWHDGTVKSVSTVLTELFRYLPSKRFSSAARRAVSSVLYSSIFSALCIMYKYIISSVRSHLQVFVRIQGALFW